MTGVRISGPITLGRKGSPLDRSQWDARCLRIIGHLVPIVTRPGIGGIFAPTRLTAQEWHRMGYEAAARALGGSNIIPRRAADHA